MRFPTRAAAAFVVGVFLNMEEVGVDLGLEEQVLGDIGPHPQRDLGGMHARHARAQDAEEVVQARMAKANNEISHWAEYDYVVINDDLESTLQKIRTILDAERMKRGRQTGIPGFVGEVMG